jgi:hypothetical protein
MKSDTFNVVHKRAKSDSFLTGKALHAQHWVCLPFSEVKSTMFKVFNIAHNSARFFFYQTAFLDEIHRIWNR